MDTMMLLYLWAAYMVLATVTVTVLGVSLVVEEVVVAYQRRKQRPAPPPRMVVHRKRTRHTA